MHCLDPKSGLNVNTVIRTNRLVTADTWYRKVILSSYSVQCLLFKIKRDFIEIACKVESYSWHNIYWLFRCIDMNNWRIHTSAVGFITSVPVNSPVFLPRVVLQLRKSERAPHQNSWIALKCSSCLVFTRARGRFPGFQTGPKTAQTETKPVCMCGKYLFGIHEVQAGAESTGDKPRLSLPEKK